MKHEFADWPCSVARAAGVFGDSWTLLILRDAMYGLARYDEFQRSLHIARNTLSDRLGKLVDAGVMTKRFYQDNPPRYEYLLTEMGRDFFPVLAAMLSWGDKWLDGGGASPAHHHLATRRKTTRPHRQWPALQALRVQEPPLWSLSSMLRRAGSGGHNREVCVRCEVGSEFDRPCGVG